MRETTKFFLIFLVWFTYSTVALLFLTITPSNICTVNMPINSISLDYLKPCDQLSDLDNVAQHVSFIGRGKITGVITIGGLIDNILTGFYLVLLWMLLTFLSYKIYKGKISFNKFRDVYFLVYVSLFLYAILHLPHLLGYLPYIQINGIFDLSIGVVVIPFLWWFILYGFFKREAPKNALTVSFLFTFLAGILFKLKSIMVLYIINNTPVPEPFLLPYSVLISLFIVAIIAGVLLTRILIMIFARFNVNLGLKKQIFLFMALMLLLLYLVSNLPSSIYDSFLVVILGLIFALKINLDTILLAFITLYLYKKENIEFLKRDNTKIKAGASISKNI